MTEGQSESRSHPNNDAQSKSPGWTFADLVALITGLAAAIYSLGLVALVIPIYRYTSADLSTALFAASLVPRTTVVGYGVRNFVFAWFLGALIALFVVRCSWPLLRWLGQSAEIARWEVERSTFPGYADLATPRILVYYQNLVKVTLVTTGMGTVGALTASLPIVDRWFHTLPIFLSWRILLFAALCTVLCGALGLFTARFIFAAGVFSRRIYTPFLAFAIFAGFIGALPFTVLSPPPLPETTIDLKAPATDVKGALLPSTTDFWYILSYRCNAQPMRALPNDQVKKAYIASVEVPPSVETVVKGCHGKKGMPPGLPVKDAEKSGKSTVPSHTQNPR